MGNQNVDTNKNQGQEKNIQNPGQNPNTKNPQQGFDKNRHEADEEISEKEDLYGNRKNQGDKNRPEKH